MRTIFRVLFLYEYIYFYIILTLLDAAVSPRRGFLIVYEMKFRRGLFTFNNLALRGT